MESKVRDNLQKLVRDSYQAIASDFNVTRQKKIWPEIEKIVSRIKDGDKILDIGCGNGRLLSVLANKQINYLGVDNSSELIKLAQRNYPNQQFKIGDILQLDLIPEKNFDYIFCIAVLQHIPSKKWRLEALKQLKEKIGVEGQIIVSNWNLWANPKHRPLLFKSYWSKILGKNQLDFGDIVFPWKNSQGQPVSSRYYHAFTALEIKKMIKLSQLRVANKIINKYNYWYILKK